MSIQILPAQLANQIAAGEVVERPASVVKELLENSLDAGADSITIDIDKGGAKKIRITDNGCGIVKQELALALSRHATSKIKNLTDLEGIASLGFRGEALASISSVARLTLISKPKDQENAWQASAQGRDMQVEIQPAAHPNGTTIDIVDLFFNTPARRKFLRTEKTEFSHIEEVIKRIALARFDVAFTLIHNGKVVKQYKKISNEQQKIKRVAQVCGAKFAEQAIPVFCQHDDLTLTGWIGAPEFYRSQNDLCYSYVNGRMMRDKLINHAIRQAFSDSLPDETYPAFVLFLTLDVREVDVNVHPAKHEVRFQQGRYIHDFIFTVIQNALAQPPTALNNINTSHCSAAPQFSEPEHPANYEQPPTDYITPLAFTSATDNYQVSEPNRSASPTNMNSYQRSAVSQSAAQSYGQLLTTVSNENAVQPLSNNTESIKEQSTQWLAFVEPDFVLCRLIQQVRLLSVSTLNAQLVEQQITEKWVTGIISQPLLLPLTLSLSKEHNALFEQYHELMEKTGIVIEQKKPHSIIIRQVPAFLRSQNVAETINHLFEYLQNKGDEMLTEQQWIKVIARLVAHEQNTEQSAHRLFLQASQYWQDQFNHIIELNSEPLDLTSTISKLKQNV